MSYTAYKRVQFGAGKAALATVGYQLFNADGTANGSRITAGVAERPAGTGSYAATVTFPDAFTGEIRWDTGETPTPAYASEEINPGSDEYTDAKASAVKSSADAASAAAGAASTAASAAASAASAASAAAVAAKASADAVKVVTDKVDTALEPSAGAYRLTVAALAQAPTGGGSVSLDPVSKAILYGKGVYNQSDGSVDFYDADDPATRRVKISPVAGGGRVVTVY
jgi:hypothetical protein